ncbi:MAG: hypothetical protein ACK4VY_00955 [Brevundimonas sp.]
MNDHPGYQWAIEERQDEWVWLIHDGDRQMPVVTGIAPSRAHAAACVVRALILGVTMDQSRTLAA